MKIDLHTHILPDSWPNWCEQFGTDGFAQLEHADGCRAKIWIDGEFFREVESNCWDPIQRIQECDAARVNVQVLSTVPVLFHYWAPPHAAHDTSRFLNDHIAGVVTNHPDRFIGLGTIPLQDTPRAIQELERCQAELKLPGVEIGTHVDGHNLDDPRFRDLFAAAEQLGMAIFVHPWAMLGAERMRKYWLRWLVGMPAETSLAICSLIFSDTMQKFPKLRLAFAHGGGAFPFTLGRIERGYNVRPDLCAPHTSVPPREQIRSIYLDTLVHDANALRYLIDLFSPERLALGSDYPFPLGEAEAGSLIESMDDLTDEVKHRLLAGTALEFLNLAAENYAASGSSSSTSSG